MNNPNEVYPKPSMPYIADPIKWLDSTVTESDYRRKERNGNCAKCGTAIDTKVSEETFSMDAGHGFNWIVSNRTSKLCQHCFDEMKACSKPSNYVQEKVCRVGKYSTNEHDYEIIAHDSDFDTPTEAESTMILTAIKLEDERMKHEEFVDAILDLISEAGVTEPMHKQIDGLVAQYERDITSRISLRLGNIKENMMADIKEAVSQPA